MKKRPELEFDNHIEFCDYIAEATRSQMEEILNANIRFLALSTKGNYKYNLRSIKLYKEQSQWYQKRF